MTEGIVIEGIVIKARREQSSSGFGALGKNTPLAAVGGIGTVTGSCL